MRWIQCKLSTMTKVEDKKFVDLNINFEFNYLWKNFSNVFNISKKTLKCIHLTTKIKIVFRIIVLTKECLAFFR